MAHGHLDVNPAGEVIDAALPRRKGVPEHHRSLPYQKVGAALNTVEGIHKRARRATVLPIPRAHVPFAQGKHEVRRG